MATELVTAHRAPSAARRMADAANRFLAALSNEQRATATFQFEGDERYFWHYTPIARNGLLLKHMTGKQRQLAMELLATGLSERGTRQVHQIIDLEPTLREHEKLDQMEERWDRATELYYFSVFGEPGGSDPWSWRVGGHHVGLHFTVVDGELISPLPLFFGANPAEIQYGPEKGLRTLPEEEDLARELVQSLDADQQSAAIVAAIAPADILTTNIRTVTPEMTQSGLALSQMRDGQRDLLVRLIRHYVSRAADDLAGNEWTKIEGAGLDTVTFAWAGPTERSRSNGHYYNVKGPTFMLEYDNTQNGANHIHSVWRDFTNDWGEDLLASHLMAHHR